MSVLRAVLQWFRSLFWTKEIEITLIGLANAGKTSLVNVLTAGQYSETMVPTVGFNLKRVTKGNVTIKLWDIAGQPRFRSIWDRYCRGVNAIIFMVDASPDASDLLPQARTELHSLLQDPSLAATPVLVLANKSDLDKAMGAQQIIEAMDLASISDREISCYSISCKNQRNIDITLQWLIKRA